MAWFGFLLFVVLMLALDLGFFHKERHEIRIKEALLWTVVWIALAFAFDIGIFFIRGTEPALQFMAGFLIEKSLSVDNLFIFLLIFNYFKVPKRFQHRVLFWGVLGALIMRGVFILGGIALIARFHWLIYVFGGLLILTGVKIAFDKDKKIEPDRNPIIRLFRTLLPFTKDYDEKGSLVVRREKGWAATPLLAVLIVVETTDVIFAIDSIPAIFAVTLDPFIVFTSNVFAILGLRSLYFALAGVMEAFYRLNVGLSLILVFVGAKMLVSDFYKVPIAVSLTVIFGTLLLSVLASLAWPPKK